MILATVTRNCSQFSLSLPSRFIISVFAAIFVVAHINFITYVSHQSSSILRSCFCISAPDPIIFSTPQSVCIEIQVMLLLQYDFLQDSDRAFTFCKAKRIFLLEFLS